MFFLAIMGCAFISIYFPRTVLGIVACNVVTGNVWLIILIPLTFMGFLVDLA